MSASNLQNLPIVVLKEGSETKSGIDFVISNINACNEVASIVAGTLGPRGLDKMLVTEHETVLTNDGATIIRKLDLVYPMCRIFCEIAESQEKFAGDGTTSVVLFANELLNEAKELILLGMTPLEIIDGFILASKFAAESIEKVKFGVVGTGAAFKVAGGIDNVPLDAAVLAEIKGDIQNEITTNATAREDSATGVHRDVELLQMCAETALRSKIVWCEASRVAELIVSAVLLSSQNDSGVGRATRLASKRVGIKMLRGGSVEDSSLIKGVVFKRPFSYAGADQQPKHFSNAKVLLLNIELELSAERSNSEMRLETGSSFQALVEAEWSIFQNKLEQIADSGAQVVFSRLPVGDFATQFFADRKIYCVGRVEADDMERCALATGARAVSVLDSSARLDKYFGVCSDFAEETHGEEKMVVLCNDSEKVSAVTLLLRGGAQEMLEEAKRAVEDGLAVVRRLVDTPECVGGAGSIEMLLSTVVRHHALTALPRADLQPLWIAFSRALEIIPKILAENAGLDVIPVVNKLRQSYNAHKTTLLVQPVWYGVDCSPLASDEKLKDRVVENTSELVKSRFIQDAKAKGVWAPAAQVKSIIQSAVQAVTQILSVDHLVANPKSNQGYSPQVRLAK